MAECFELTPESIFQSASWFLGSRYSLVEFLSGAPLRLRKDEIKGVFFYRKKKDRFLVKIYDGKKSVVGINKFQLARINLTPRQPTDFDLLNFESSFRKYVVKHSSLFYISVSAVVLTMVTVFFLLFFDLNQISQSFLSINCSIECAATHLRGFFHGIFDIFLRLLFVIVPWICFFSFRNVVSDQISLNLLKGEIFFGTIFGVELFFSWFLSEKASGFFSGLMFLVGNSN